MTAPASSSSSAAAAAGGAGTPTPKKTARVLTERCAHGPHGACQYCAGATDEELRAAKEGPLNKTDVARHAAKSAASGADAGTGDIEWLCRHRPDQMCVNCAPLHKGEEVKLEMLCNHAPGARCINCLPPDTVVAGRKYQTYDEYREHLRDKCSHSFAATCVNCAPPGELSYKLKPDCGRHKPWPGGICLDCAPATVDLAPQKYRHVDFITVNATADVAALIDVVSANRRYKLQRAALLYGRYAPDPAYRHGVRAVVDALYEPPQSWDADTGAIHLKPDDAAALADRVAAALGLVAVGWMFSRDRRDAALGVHLLPHELYAMAAQQLAHSPRPDGRSGSQWVTLTTFVGDSGSYELQGYQATDQLVAMVRDGVLAVPRPADVKFNRRAVRKDVPGELPVPDILFKDQLRGAHRVDAFDPDTCFVSIEAAGAAPAPPAAAPGSEVALAAAKSAPILKFADGFPRCNRDTFGDKQDVPALARYLRAHARDPLAATLANFHVLVFLARVVDVDTAVAAAAAIAAGKPIPDGVEALLAAITAT